MANKNELQKAVDEFFSGNYDVTSGYVIPNISDIQFGKTGRELELAMMFVDIRESTKIVSASRRVTAAKMYKSFLHGVAKIARINDGELRSFNGDGVLVAFAGESKRTNASKAALQISWFCEKVLKPKLSTYFENNLELQDFEFDFGIGIDVGNVLVVRGGIKGENNNDLVWVGNATNYAVKLSGLSDSGHHIYISENVYKGMKDSSKFGGASNLDMWEKRIWSKMGDMSVYRSNWTWGVS